MDENRGRRRAPDVEAGATVTMKRLRFTEKPREVEARGHGSPGVETTSEGERRNLPDEVQADQVYRDALIRRHAGVWLSDDLPG
jgi:hypothetical protein